MGTRMTQEELLELIYARNYDQLKDERLRLVCVKVPGKEISLAQLIGTAGTRIYQNMGLHIGTHLGEDHTGETIGILHITPADAAVAAADIAVKSGEVQLGFLDRFAGSVILLGGHSQVRYALEGVVAFFRDELGFAVCDITEE